MASSDTETDSDTPPLRTLGFSKLPIIKLELALLDQVKAASAAATRAARMYFEVEHGKLTSFLIGPGKKTGLLSGVFVVLGGRGVIFLTGLGTFQSAFLYRFLQTLFRTLIHEEIIP